jgi:hypothetical protein
MPYSAKDVDEAVATFEAGCAKVMGKKNTTETLLKAAEVDFLVTCQSVEAVLHMAIEDCAKDNRKQLAKLFGGTCERIGRCQVVLDSIGHLSDENQADKRWNRCRGKIKTIEALLDEMGIYVQWNPNAPKDMVYDGLQPRFAPGATVTMKPVFGKGSGVPYEYQINKPLPSGLNLNAVTGKITGQFGNVEHEENTWVITGHNDRGTCSTSITFIVKKPPPTALDYPKKKLF